jgi:hypothetical protein
MQAASHHDGAIYTHVTRVVVWSGEPQDYGVSVDVTNQLPDTT